MVCLSPFPRTDSPEVAGQGVGDDEGSVRECVPEPPLRILVHVPFTVLFGTRPHTLGRRLGLSAGHPSVEYQSLSGTGTDSGIDQLHVHKLKDVYKKYKLKDVCKKKK